MPETADGARLDAVLRSSGRAALARAYAAYKDDLLTLAACILGDRHSAEDVLQDVFVSLASRVGTLGGVDNVRSYVLTCCVNRSRDLLRQRARRQRVAVTAGPPERAEVAPAADATAEAADDIQQTLMALTALPDKQREVVALRIHGQMKFREIARLQGVSVNTVQSRYRQALDALRAVLPDAGEEQ